MYQDSASRPEIEAFLLALALCNTTVPVQNEEGHIKYNAASPDDGALVKAAHNLGYTLKERKSLGGGVERVTLEAMAWHKRVSF